MKPATALAVGVALGVLVGIAMMPGRGLPGFFTGLAAGIGFGVVLARQARR